MTKDELVHDAGPDLGPILRELNWIPGGFVAAYIVEHDPEANRPYLAEVILLGESELLMVRVEGNGKGSIKVRLLNLLQISEINGHWTLDHEPSHFEVRLGGDEVLALPIKAQDARATPAKAEQFMDALLERLRRTAVR